MPEITILKGHVSPETAYMVNDYPYGFRQRCKIRYWIEYKPKMGCRFCFQTTNPKKPGEFWNSPKKGTYSHFGACLYIDHEDGHVHHTGLDQYCEGAEAQEWQEIYGEGIPEAAQDYLKRMVAAKLAYKAN